MTIRERLTNSQIILLRSLAKRGGGRSVTIQQWQRAPALPLWRRGIVEIWYRQSPGESLQGPYYALSVAGFQLASSFL
jgi:hypothetical protein